MRRRGRHEPFVIAIRAPGAKVTLTKEDIITIAQALADAEQLRRLRASEWCQYCQIAAAGACHEHLDDLDAADAYRDLAAELGRVLPAPPTPEMLQ